MAPAMLPAAAGPCGPIQLLHPPQVPASTPRPPPNRLLDLLRPANPPHLALTDAPRSFEPSDARERTDSVPHASAVPAEPSAPPAALEPMPVMDAPAQSSLPNDLAAEEGAGSESNGFAAMAEALQTHRGQGAAAPQKRPGANISTVPEVDPPLKQRPAARGDRVPGTRDRQVDEAGPPTKRPATAARPAVKRPAAAVKARQTSAAHARKKPAAAKAAAVKLGCGRCRGSRNGCSVCRDPGWSGLRLDREEWKKYAAKHGLK